MKLSINTLVLAMGTTLILTLSFLLYQDITRTATGTGKPVGVVTFKLKKAQRKFARQVVWHEVATETPIYANDTIRTEDLSETVIKLKDGTEIKLNESSMIVVAVQQDKLNINFARGSIKANREGRGDSIKITAGGMDVALGNGDLNLDGSSAKVNLTVNKGEAIVSSKSGEKTITDNQQVTATGDDVRVYELNIKLKTPGHDTIIATPDESTNVNFNWEQLKELDTVNLQVSKSYSFRNASDIKVKGTTRQMKLDQGVYYWRVQAKNPTTGKIESSKVRRITIAPNEPLVLLSPSQDSRIYYKDKLPLVTFRWTKSDLASSYRIQISRDNSFNEMTFNSQIQSSTMGLDNLTEGDWYWRVEKILPSSIILRKGTPVSSTGKLTITRTTEVKPPLPLYPAPGKNLSMQKVENNGLAFTWKVTPEITSSSIEIARDNQFKDTLASGETTRSVYKLKDPLTPGTYYWRLRGKLQDGSFTGYSSSELFKVITIDSITPINPGSRYRVSLPREGAAASILFSWKKVEMAGTYTVTLAADNEFKAVINTGTTTDASLTLANIKAGTYYWKVTLEGEDGSIASKPRELIIQEPLVRPVIVSPIGGVVDMLGKKALTVAWKGQAGSTHYRVGLFRQAAGGAVNIGTYEVAGTRLNITDLKKLNLGTFYVTIRALEKEQGKTIRQSGESRREFSIILGDKNLKKPEIQLPDVIYIEQ